MRLSRRSVWVPLVAFGITACGSSESRVPTTLVVTPSATLNFSTQGRSQHMHAAVLDANGDTIGGRTFTWVSSSPTTASVSQAAADSAIITAGASGTATVTVTSGSLQKPIAVNVVLVAQKITAAGNGQVASASVTLSAPISLTLKDSSNFAARGDTIHFAVTSGGGSVSPLTAVTDASGKASASWTLGASGDQTVTATGPGVNYVFTATAVAATQAGFQISLANVGPAFSPAVKAAFDSAVAYWGRAITADLPDVSYTGTASNTCGAPFPAVGPVNVDDVVILALVDSIDGPGQILGGAGPCIIRTTNVAGGQQVSSSIIGAMIFDSADVEGLVASNELALVVKHEMAHVLGFGTYWERVVQVQGPGDTLFAYGCLQLPTTANASQDTYYNCARGLTVFDSIGGTGYTGGNKVPVENCVGITGCGSGTFNSHWRESVFGTELMTGYLNSGQPNPVSALTLAEFQDEGYSVDLSQAEAYSKTFTAPSAFRLMSVMLNLGNDVRLPRFGITPDGRRIVLRTTPIRWR